MKSVNFEYMSRCPGPSLYTVPYLVAKYYFILDLTKMRVYAQELGSHLRRCVVFRTHLLGETRFTVVNICETYHNREVYFRSY